MKVGEFSGTIKFIDIEPVDKTASTLTYTVTTIFPGPAGILVFGSKTGTVTVIQNGEASEKTVETGIIAEGFDELVGELETSDSIVVSNKNAVIPSER